MVRKQAYISADQEQMLKRWAKALGVSEAELIRRGIDHITAFPQLCTWTKVLGRTN